MLKINEHVFLCFSSLSSTLQIPSQRCGGGGAHFVYLCVYLFTFGCIGSIKSMLMSEDSRHRKGETNN